MRCLLTALTSHICARLARDAVRSWAEKQDTAGLSSLLQEYKDSKPRSGGHAGETDNGTPDTVLRSAVLPLSKARDEESLSSMLQELHAACIYAVLVDFKTPERNIEFPAWMLAAPFRAIVSSRSSLFKKKGGLEGLLYREKHNFSVISRRTHLGGAFVSILVQCIAQEEGL